MTDITLVLPFALPSAEMAPHLLRALQAPSLAALLSRHSTLQFHQFDNNSRVLPHEAWLAHALGLAPSPEHADAGAPLATACMRGCGLGAEAASGHWFIVQPAHVQVSSTHPSLADPRGLSLSEGESRAFYESARPYFEEVGKPLLYGAPDLWFMRADDWSGLTTASPDFVVHQNLSDWLPEGERARDYRRLQNEIQMLWHQHPVNEARQARGLQAVNSYWAWGGAAVHNAANAAAAPSALLAVSSGPSWMEAVAAPELRQPLAADLIARGGITVVGDLIPSAQAGEWAEWIAALQHIDEVWCAPLLAGLKAGRVGRVSLVLSHRDGWLDASSTAMAQRKFWRKPTLNALKQA